LQDLDVWASAHALGSVENDKAYDTQGKTIAALALGYLQFRGANLDDARRKRVVAWLVAMAEDLRHFVDISKGHSAENNHRYWSGLGVASAAVAADRSDLFNWGVDSARIGLRQIQADGTLPLELSRAERARDYHLYALAPLVMLAELSAANGIDLYGAYDGALRRLVARVVASLDDASYFEKVTGRQQVAYPGGQGVPPYRLAWLEPYNRRFPSAQGAALLQRMRPLVETGLGGNLTLVYAHSDSK
jgi:poly(beta-D-mannuronate) lyase